MTFAAYESSVHGGHPVHLYDFVQGEAHFRFTSLAQDVVAMGYTWAAVPLRHSAIVQSSEINQDGVQVTFPRDHTFAQPFTGGLVESVTRFTLYKGHLDDPDEEYRVEWKGRVLSGAYDGPSIVLSCESIYTRQRRPGLKVKFQRTCPYVLYGPGCGVDKELHAVPGLVAGLSGNVLTCAAAAGYADNWFRGGMVLAPDGSLRYVTAHVGSQLIMTRPNAGLAELVASRGWNRAWNLGWNGVSVTLYPGCDLLDTTCADKFDNLANTLAIRYIPEKSPMGGSSIV